MAFLISVLMTTALASLSCYHSDVITMAESAVILVEQAIEEKSIASSAAPISVASLKMTVSDQEFIVKLEDNIAAREFGERLPLSVTMADLNNNEKYYYLTENLPTQPQSVGQIHIGDLMLYGDDCLGLFYKDFSTSYRYTPLGHIENTNGLAEIAGSDSISAQFVQLAP